MRHHLLILIVLLSCPLSCSSSEGGEGERCKSTGILGNTYCDGDLVCNETTFECEKAHSVAAGGGCSSDAGCLDELICRLSACRQKLGPGEACGSSGDSDCADGLDCVKSCNYAHCAAKDADVCPDAGTSSSSDARVDDAAIDGAQDH